jgi:hypothetical protein
MNHDPILIMAIVLVASAILDTINYCCSCISLSRVRSLQSTNDSLNTMTTPTDWRELCAEPVDIATAPCNPDDFAVRVSDCAAILARAAILAQPEPQGPTLEPRGCPTPGACSCPTMPTVPPELIRALELAEAALAGIGDAEREPGDDLAWAEARAAQDLPRIRAVLARWGRPAIKPVSVSEQDA